MPCALKATNIFWVFVEHACISKTAGSYPFARFPGQASEAQERSGPGQGHRAN